MQFKQVTKNYRWLLLVIVLLLLNACGGPPNVDWQLTLSGDVATPTSYSFEELTALPQVELNDVYMEKSRGEDEVRSFSGVSLTTLFEDAGISDDYVSITAVAADGYATEISRDEMVDGIVALKDGGDWIAVETPDEGPIRLVFPTTPANRWVFQVTEIIINK